MARQYDRNRHRKIYPINRRTPSPAIPAAGVTMETATVTFSSSASETYTFAAAYSSAPIVIATSNDNVNIYISSINTTQVVINASEAFSGSVFLQITES